MGIVIFVVLDHAMDLPPINLAARESPAANYEFDRWTHPPCSSSASRKPNKFVHVVAFLVTIT